MTQQPPKDLEPCPFCGGDAQYNDWSDLWDSRPRHAVDCINEECPVDCRVGMASSKEEAYTRWNTRAAQSPLDVREAAELACEKLYALMQGFTSGDKMRSPIYQRIDDIGKLLAKALSSSGANTKEE